ncbi:MAG: hypothetical protein ABW352_03045 [Polyangiales bacterium]
MEQNKKQYVKPALKLHGSVEAVTGFTGEHDVFGGGFLSTKAKCKASGQGPADRMS